MAERKGKKRKEPERACGSPDFRRGSICRITMHNFMTYSHASVEPGPWLNVLAGPNGTGKSTIICAIGLCLGGPLKSIARGDTIESFVKTGETSGWVEVELYQGSEGGRANLRVRLEIDLDAEASRRTRWYLNDQPKKKSDVDQALKRLGIQIDNRCAFLAQDRVREFALMTPKEILHETQKAVDPHLDELHSELKDCSKQLRELERRRGEAKQRGDQLEEEVARLRKLLEREKQREDLQERLRLMKIKKLWLEYGDAKALYDEAKEKRREIEKEIEEEERKFSPVVERANELQRELDAIKKKAAKADNDFKNIDEQRTQASEKADTLRDQQARLYGEIEDVMEEMEKRTQAVREAEARVRKAEKELKNAEDIAPLEQQQKELYEQKIEVNLMQQEIQNNAKAIRKPIAGLIQEKKQILEALKQLENAKYRYIRAVARSDRDITGMPDLFQWVEETQRAGKFEQKVYGPLFAEVEVKDQLHKAYLEQALGWAKFSFVCMSLNDQKLLFNAIRKSKGKWPSVIVLYITSEPAQRHPYVATTDEERKQLASLGVQGFLDELVTAPPVVMKAMVELYNINRIACCSREPELEEVKKILSWRPATWDKPFPPMSILYTPESMIVQSTSAYSNEVFTRVEQMRPPRVFAVEREEEGDKEELKARIAQIDARIAEIETRAKQEEARAAPLLRQIQEITQQITALQGRMERVRKLQTALRSAQADLKKKQQELENYDGERKIEKLKREIARIGQQRMQTMRMLKDLIQKWVDKAFLREGLQLHVSALSIVAEAAVKKVEEIKMATQQSRAKLENARSVEEKYRQAARSKLAIAKEAVGGRSLDDDLMAELRWDASPDDLKQLDAQIDEVSVQLDVVQAIDPDTRRRYKAREAELRKFQQEQAEMQQRIEDLRKNIETKKAEWLPELERIVGEISREFSQHYHDMGCRGEVRLGRREEDDFESYGIDIYVSYRAEADMKILSGVSNSGGEKSVATMLYLMCLHKVTKAPFRVVDEINQGMDIENERRVFDQLVRSCDRAADKKDPEPQCQYFLVTPKLLPGLNFTKSITVIFPFNGAYMCSQDDLQLGPYIERMKRRKAAAGAVEAASQA